MTQEIYGGAMSGTSLDGVDVVLAAFDADPPGPGAAAAAQVLAHVYQPYRASLRDAVLALCHGQQRRTVQEIIEDIDGGPRAGRKRAYD